MSISVAKDYLPTILNSRSLLARLAIELNSLKDDFRSAWPEFKTHPFKSILEVAQSVISRSRRALLSGNVLAAFVIVAGILCTAVFIDHTRYGPDSLKSDNSDVVNEIKILNLPQPDNRTNDDSIGRGGNRRVGFTQGSGEGSGEVRQLARGGGSGGDRQPIPPQNGKLPPSSTVLASIPKTPPVYAPVLPVAGMDIDPALWKDMKAPVFGDPRSNSNESSKGPGDGGGIGTNHGLGIGEGNGPGFGPGNNGNMGNGDKHPGCCGGSAGHADGDWSDRIFPPKDVEQRARLITKPEPQYTEEARRNQITGTVMLRVVFSSAGHVEQIRAMQTLPFGLTEKAIAAARQIRFQPATKGGRPVSVWMQLEYNFNLY